MLFRTQRYTAIHHLRIWLKVIVLFITMLFLGMLCGSFSPQRLFAFERGYLPLSTAELNTRFTLIPVKNAYPTWYRETITIPTAGVGGVRIRPAAGPYADDAILAIEGKDGAGAPWRVYMEYAAMGCSVWRADLDRDGREDIVIAGFTGGCGLAPPMHVTVLLFDRQGRPVPWSIDGYFEQDRKGIRDFLDMNHDRRAELVRMSFDDGYWITSAYEARAGYWRRIHGPHGRLSFPLYTRFTTRANRKAVKPSHGRSPRVDRLGNTGTSEQSGTYLTAIKSWVDDGEDALVTTSDGRTCRLTYWYSTAAIVIDRPHRRDSAFLNASEESRKLLKEIVDRRLPVRMNGWRRPHNVDYRNDTCVPEVIWSVDRSSGR